MFLNALTRSHTGTRNAPRSQTIYEYAAHRRGRASARLRAHAKQVSRAMRAYRAILRAVGGCAQCVREMYVRDVSAGVSSLCIVLWCDTSASNCIMMLRVSHASACVRACSHDITRRGCACASLCIHVCCRIVAARYLRGPSA